MTEPERRTPEHFAARVDAVADALRHVAASRNEEPRVFSDTALSFPRVGFGLGW